MEDVNTLYVDELRRAIEIRSKELGRVVSDLQGSVPKARSSLHRAYNLVRGLPHGLTALATSEIDRAPDPTTALPFLQILLRHLSLVADFVEDHLAHGGRHELSQALSDEVSEELGNLNLEFHNVVISHGEATNFTTLFGDIDAHVNGPVDLNDPSKPEVERFFALFRVPRVEGSGVFWKPILLGHEVAHVYVGKRNIVDQIDLASTFDFDKASSISSSLGPDESLASNSRVLFRISQSWAKELLCDAHALHRFGPSAIAALAEYFATIGALDNLSETHPPGWLRIHLMLDWLGPVNDARLRQVIEPWDSLASNAPSFEVPWADFLSQFFVDHGSKLKSLAGDCPADGYKSADRHEEIRLVADRLGMGIAGSETVNTTGGRTEKQDVVNAAWIVRSEEAETPVDSLARKAIENIAFIDSWLEADGDLPAIIVSDPPDRSVGSALSQASLLARLSRRDEPGGIVVTPLLQFPKGAALDLRLGNRFIVFRRTGDSSFDPLDRDTDSRAFQVYRELSWTEQIVLHPQELLLAATLEYLVLPADITAQVITRSSYGRLGLLSATAVQIHPNYHGCLTLELVNLSNLPLVLTPGERVAQLVAWTTDPVEPGDEKYHCPIGPEFSKARVDAESDVLRAIRGE
ncbi:MAG: dCTP deaminase [Acidimicrobiia bacterium]|nr:dCTP deaminase [Acidimicrobiia bacterium]